MGIFIESLKRLYKTQQIDEVVVSKLLSTGKITKEESDYILGKDGE